MGRKKFPDAVEDDHINWQRLVQKNARAENRRRGRVQTPDGAGVIIGMENRMNTNGGPGTQQYKVQLEDGRIRHYSANALVETP